MPVLMVIVFFSLYFGANFYVFLRLWQMLPAGSVLRPVLVGVALVLALSIFIYIFLGRWIPYFTTSFFANVGTSWIIILLYLFFIVLACDLLPLTGLYDRTAMMRSNPMTFCIIAAVTAVIMLAGNINYHNKRRIEITVDTSLQTGRQMQRPVKIVAVSDLHLGHTIGPKELGRWVELINSEKPDMVLIAGDLIDSDPRPLFKKDVAAVLKRIQAPDGIYIVTGNHEFIAGIDASMAFLEETGFTILRDSVIRAAGVDIMGRDDISNKRRQSIDSLASGLDKRVPLIIIDHQPVALDDAVAAGASLQISGHTHRGQVWPVTWVTDRIFEDSHGLLVKGNTAVFVSSGIGIWGGKFRIGSSSDYVVINLI